MKRNEPIFLPVGERADKVDIEVEVNPANVKDIQECIALAVPTTPSGIPVKYENRLVAVVTLNNGKQLITPPHTDQLTALRQRTGIQPEYNTYLYANTMAIADQDRNFVTEALIINPGNIKDIMHHKEGYTTATIDGKSHDFSRRIGTDLEKAAVHAKTYQKAILSLLNQQTPAQQLEEHPRIEMIN